MWSCHRRLSHSSLESTWIAPCRPWRLTTTPTPSRGFFVSLEAAIAALAEKHGVEIEPNHWRKAEAAEQLYAQGAITTNFAPALRTPNEARKEAVYDGEDPDFGEQSLEDLASEVELVQRLGFSC